MWDLAGAAVYTPARQAANRFMHKMTTGGWLLLAILLNCCSSMIIHRPWNSRHWCTQITQPYWPFAYEKYEGQTKEWKGRVTSNTQDMRHECTTRGGESKCHICEDIQCGQGNSQSCHYQLQGIPWTVLSKNIPTVTDVPWAVGDAH